MSLYYVYIIKSLKTGRYYTGSTQALEERLRQHNENITLSTRNRGPFELVFHETYNTLGEARRREIQIKRYKGGRAFKELLTKSLGP